MKSAFTILILMLISFNSFSQEWININSPFNDPTPSPTWKTGDFLEIVYELNLRSSPDTINPQDWITISDVDAISLSTEFLIRSNSYKVEFPGVSVVGGKYKFKLYGPDYDVSQKIKKNNWKSISYNLKYNLKGQKKETPVVTHTNDAYRGTEGTIVVNRLDYNTEDKNFEVEIYSSHQALEFSSAQLQNAENGTRISIFRRQTEPTTINMNKENKFSYKLKLDAESAFDILKISAANGHKLYVDIMGASATNPEFAQAVGMVPVNYSVPLKVEKIEGNSVEGLNQGVIIVTTNTPTNSLSLIFDEAPVEGNESTKAIDGKSTGGLPSNIFLFNIPSNEIKFKYGKHRFHLEGTPVVGNPLSAASYNFEKKEINIQTSSIIQEGNSCTINFAFSSSSPGDVDLVFDKLKDTKRLKPVDQQNKSFTTTLTLDDQAIKNNLVEVGNDKFLNVYVTAFGKNYTTSSIRVKVLDTKEAIKKLEDISGGRNARKAKIVKYLTDNNFEGNITEMSDRIFLELAKNKESRNWSETWTTVGKFMKPAAGLLMLLV